MLFTNNIKTSYGISHTNALIKILIASIAIALCMQLGACLTFSDASKSVVAKSRIIVQLPDNKSSFLVAFYAPCLAYICPVIRDKPLDLDYNPAYEIASALGQILDARGIKSGPQYYLKFVVVHSELKLYAIKDYIHYSLRAELSDDAGNTIDKSSCFNYDIYKFDAIDSWRNDPEVLKKELRGIATKCVSNFRNELNI